MAVISLLELRWGGEENWKKKAKICGLEQKEFNRTAKTE